MLGPYALADLLVVVVAEAESAGVGSKRIRPVLTQLADRLGFRLG